MATELLAFEPRLEHQLNRGQRAGDRKVLARWPQQDPFEKYARNWLQEYGINLIVERSDTLLDGPGHPDEACYAVILQRGERSVSLQYKASIVDARLRQIPSLLDVLFALAWESRFRTIGDAVEHGYSREQAVALVRFGQKVRRVVPGAALEQIRAVETLHNACQNEIVPPIAAYFPGSSVQ